jgi:hypothetical protein
MNISAVFVKFRTSVQVPVPDISRGPVVRQDRLDGHREGTGGLASFEEGRASAKKGGHLRPASFELQNLSNSPIYLPFIGPR